ncbi:MAG: hypothetical protein IJ760_03680 [Bacteroidales bacterium]|nr:hypothetical protein [Bacteroidales bacterium]
MKKKIASFSALLFFSVLTFTLFSACDSDTNSYLDVLVLDELTRKPVSGVNVELYSRNCDVSDYNYQKGVTGADGIFSTYYIAPAILSVKCIYPLAEGGYRQGMGTVRLLEGQTKTAEITLESSIRY